MAITSGGSQRRKDMSPAKMVGWFDLGQLELSTHTRVTKAAADLEHL